MHCVPADTWEKAQLAAEEKPHCVLNKKPSGRRFKEHRAARWIGFAEPATPW
jgi:hypothetical protein